MCVCACCRFGLYFVPVCSTVMTTRTGKNNNNWKGGRIFDGNYWRIFCPEHPNAGKNGYVFEHVKVFTEYYGCCMIKGSHIHHKNENPTDNRIENLEGMTSKQHNRHHKCKDMSNRRCNVCNSSKTHVLSDGRIQWMGNEIKGFTCRSCYDKMLRKMKKSLII